MPRQDRVTLVGDFVAVLARGTHGCLDVALSRIPRPYRLTSSIYCLLEIYGRRRAVMST